MASQGTPSPLSPALSQASQTDEPAHESSVQHVSVTEKTGFTYQPKIYHPHLYPQYYVPYNYSAPIPTPVPSERPRKAARKGRMRGSQNWSEQDLKALARYVKGAPDLRSDVWRQIEGRYNTEYALPNERQERRWDNMRDKWNSLKSDDPSKSVGRLPVVDPEDLPEVEGTRRDGSGRNNIDGADPAKNMFVTSRRGTDQDWTGGSARDDNSTAWQTKNGSASPSLAEMLLSSISPDDGARQNHNEAVTRLYPQQIRSQQSTIRELELKNYALQGQLYSTVYKLNREERRADRLEMRLETLEMMRTYRRRLSRRYRVHHQRSLSSSSASNRSASSADSPSSRSPSRPVLNSKRRRVDLQDAEQEKKAFHEEDEEVA